MRRSRRILKDYALSVSGAGSTNVSLNAMDLSNLDALVLFVGITSAAAAANDTLDIRLQETRDKGVTWNTRARTVTFLGNQTVSATAPETYEIQILADQSPDQPGSAYEPTGSAGATDLVVGSVRHGPFTGQYRSATGWQPAMRLRFTVASGTAAVFAGTVDIWGRSGYDY